MQNQTKNEAKTLFHSGIVDKNPRSRICIALQYWEGDREQAMRTARMMAGIERAPRSDVLFLFSYRRDANPPDEETLRIVTGVFPNTRVLKGTRAGTGHPDGCNALWVDTVTALSSISDSVRYAFTTEADVVPIRRDWINALKEETTKMTSKGAYISGFWQPRGNLAKRELEHINGNMLIDTNLPRRIQHIYHIPRTWAWDIYLAQFFHPIWIRGGWIFNSYTSGKKRVSSDSPNKSQDWTDEMFLGKQKEGYSVIHGIRGNSGETFLKKMFD